MADNNQASQPWFLKSNYPVWLPSFDNFTKRLEASLTSSDDKGWLQSTLSKGVGQLNLDDASSSGVSADNKMLTENRDLTNSSTGEPLVDLFHELDESVSGERLQDLLSDAWAQDKVSTLKIIFNARSIHLGKASRAAFYRCAGWLALNHPQTLLANLHWLSRPVIPKTVDKGDDEKAVFIELEKTDDDPSRCDVHNGVAHGYWKDLLNLVVFSVNECLSPLADLKDVMNVPRQQKGQAKSAVPREDRHVAAVAALEGNSLHRALHMTVARLFADQLRIDLEFLRDDAKKNEISLCGKWAPSHAHFHDKHTFITSTIAELLYPVEYFSSKAKTALPVTGDARKDREVYLRYAREEYRRDISALRAQLDIVERRLTDKTLDRIKYDRVPSLAMKAYTPIFATKDTERFSAFIEKVAEGKARISGATLLPSTLIKTVREGGSRKRTNEKIKEIEAKAVDNQWKSLVQRIKDSGTMENCMAVCDVSGSMLSPTLHDGTCPLDSSVGLSLLVAEVTKPPFGHKMITFSSKPELVHLDPAHSLRKKYKVAMASDWGMSTNFVAVFRDLILPLAVKNKVMAEDMVKRVFVFSDMHFDSADDKDNGDWSSSYERIQKAYRTAGYEMPELVFWNLAGARGDAVTAPKPVTASDEGTALVSGYSQGMLKAFLDKGGFEDEDAEDEDLELIETKETEDDEVLVQAKRRKIDPLAVVKKAISHKAFEMLVVVD